MIKLSPSTYVARILLVVSLTVIGFLSLTPSPPVPPDSLAWDKLQHFIAYAFVTGIVFEAWSHQTTPGRRLLQSAGVAWFYGAIIEILQAILPFGRFAEITDLAANTIGILVGCLVVYIVRLSGRKVCHGD